MSRRGHRILTGVLALAIVVLGVRLVMILTDDDGGPEAVETTESSFSVADALALPEWDAVAVTGYVHDDGRGFGVRLCHGLASGDPPRCQGPYLVLRRLDENRLDLRTAEVLDGGRGDRGRVVRWSPEPVTLLGTLSVDRLTVIEILG